MGMSMMTIINVKYMMFNSEGGSIASNILSIVFLVILTVGLPFILY